MSCCSRVTQTGFQSSAYVRLPIANITNWNTNAFRIQKFALISRDGLHLNEQWYPIYTMAVRSTGCQTGLYNRFDNGFDNRLYRVNGAWHSLLTLLDQTADRSRCLFNVWLATTNCKRVKYGTIQWTSTLNFDLWPLSWVTTTCANILLILALQSF